MKDSDELIISTNIIFTVVTTTFVAVVVVMVTRPRSDVCCLPGSCDVSAASATLGNTLLLYARPPWNRLAGQTIHNNSNCGKWWLRVLCHHYNCSNCPWHIIEARYYCFQMSVSVWRLSYLSDLTRVSYIYHEHMHINVKKTSVEV